MSVFLHNEACPSCRKRGEDQAGDNLACYSDGHKYCFKCGHFEPGDEVTRFQQTEAKPVKKFEVETCDFTLESLAYLKQFDLTNDEIVDNLKGHIDGYAFLDSKFSLIRRLHKKPKVLIQGDVVGNEPVFRSPFECKSIVLVEDVLSAIKVSRVCDSCALLKSSFHAKLLYRLSKYYDVCYLWLDPDMHEQMVKRLLPQAMPYFTNVRIVLSEKDPKYHSTEEIRSYLYANN